MQALLFLTFRSLKNGIVRSFSSPRRIIATLFFILYYLWILNPSWRSGGRGREFAMPSDMKFELPGLQVIDAITFAGFTALTVVLSLGLLSYKGGFKPADVDVLFPTPISPKLVLLFRIARDYLVTLLMPLLLLVLSYRSASSTWTTMIKNLPDPSSAAHLGQALRLSWLLISLAFVAVGYAASLFLNRPDDRFERWGKGVMWSIGIGLIALTAYVILGFSASTGVEDIVRLSESKVLRIPLFFATSATELTMAPLTGHWAGAIWGLAVLLGSVGLGLFLALAQSDYLYEQSALRAHVQSQARELQRRGDMYGLMSLNAQRGKLKAGKKTWIHRLRPTGPRALLWKDVILTLRGAQFFNLVFPILMGIGLTVMGLMAPDRSGRGNGYLTLSMMMMTVFITTMVFAQQGFSEVLRRVDLQKPMPFTPSVTVFYEVASKAIWPVLASWVSVVVALAVRPSQWQFSVAAIYLMPTVAILLSSAFFLITILFPDFDDPTQRGFRGLMFLLALIIFCAPSVLLLVAIAFLKIPIVLAALVPAVVNIGLAVLATTLSGQLYASYNPSE